MKKFFNINEIITIVMEEVNVLEYNNNYGIEEEINLPKPINDKINMLNSNDYEDFMDKIYSIAEEILIIKSGELNELNRCHEEIGYLSQSELKEYICD